MTVLRPALGLLLWLAAFTAGAQSNIELRVMRYQEIEVVTDGGGQDYRLVPATAVQPGEEVLYSIFFKNKGDLPVTGIVIDNPIPPQVYLKAGSAFGDGTDISYSIDGGKTFARPGALGLIENGLTREARADEYTHIRWVYRKTLEPGAEGLVGFRAVLR